MNRKKRLTRAVAAGLGLLVIILDSRTAVTGATEGISLCLRAAIPSLFLFFVLSGMINGAYLGHSIPFLRPLGILFKIPKGAESILLLGFLSGYPVGAQLIASACREGQITHSTARRMLGFCSNAGPAFLFGLLAPLFADHLTVWLLWGIQILSALFVGILLPGERGGICKLRHGEAVTFSCALRGAVKNMALVCGWVVLFRALLAFCSKWFLWLLPSEMQVLFAGIMELTNGCTRLGEISSESLRFTMASIMLSAGGLCVGMQTVSVTQGVGCGYYFPGKILQSLLAGLISAALAPLIFQDAAHVEFPVLICSIISISLIMYFLRRKKVVAFEGRMVYNQSN